MEYTTEVCPTHLCNSPYWAASTREYVDSLFVFLANVPEPLSSPDDVAVMWPGCCYMTINSETHNYNIVRIMGHYDNSQI